MAVATSYNVSPVGPGQTYTTLATWWAAESGGANVAAQAECYGGGNLGAVDLTGALYTGTTNYRTRIYPASGQRHDMTESGGGAYISVTDQVAITIQEPYTDIVGIRIQVDSDTVASRAIFVGNCSPILIDGINVEVTGLATVTSFIYAEASGGGRSITIRNVLLYGNNAATRANGIVTFVYGTGTMTTVVQNCAVSQLSSHVDSVGVRFNAANGRTNTVTSTNNAVTGTGGDDYRKTEASGGTVNVTQTYSLSEDATASTWGGAGNVDNATPADVWENVATDLHLKIGSDGIVAGTNLSGQFTTDAGGNSRPTYGAWDIGAIVFGGGYDVWHGADSVAAALAAASGAPDGSVGAGTGTIDMVGLSLNDGRNHFFLVRARSAAGVTETNTDRVVKVRISGGSLVGAEPNRISFASARAAAAGKIELDVLYVADGQLGTATGIQVAEIDAAGDPAWGSLVETITISGTTRKENYELADTWTHGQTVRLALRAVTAGGVAGPEIRLDPVVADTTGPDHVNWLGLTQVAES